ncbi:phosphotriesterase-related protein-like isoform X1 [Lineus longissimus]|uniref:phosphotriesterase-related protein-like isoform X1 n=2 Tax=Lineus longissimus TaxID=88925 RepID=UPI002B4D707E
MSSTGRIQTVLGPLAPSALGVTLCHEHLSIDIRYFVEKSQPPEHIKHLKYLPFCLENVDKLKDHPYFNVDNMRTDDEHDAILEELIYFKKNGGATIVDNSTVGMKRDVEVYREFARKTGVNVVAGSGFYHEPGVAASQPSVLAMAVEEMSEVMLKDLTEGCDGTDIKCGVIGEVGCSWPLTDFEKRNLRATAEVQAATGCPVILHPGPNGDGAFEMVRILQEAGCDIKKTVMSHLDRTIIDYDDLVTFAQTGCICEYDMFGCEQAYEGQPWSFNMPDDDEKVRRVKHLCDEGFEDKITVGHDHHSKHSLMKYGGHGFSHILLNIVPKMLKVGITQQQIDKILIHNPKEWLTFKC